MILESNRIHLFLFSGTMKIMNTLQLVFVLMIPPSAFVYQLLQNRCICVSTRQKLRSEMAQHLREDGIPIDPWLHGWWVDGPKMVQVSTVFPVKFPWKKRCALQNTSISHWLIYFSASFLCARQNFRGVVDLLKLLNQSKTAKIHRISRWDVNHPRTFSSAPRLDLSLTFRWKLSCWWLWGCNYCIALIEQDQLFRFEWDEWVELDVFRCTVFICIYIVGEAAFRL